MKTLPRIEPPSTAIKPQLDANPLAEIIALHGEIVTAARTSLHKALRIGELLAAEKARLPHGRWLDFVLAELPFSERTARNYLRVYANRERWKSASVADLGTAYKLLAEPATTKRAPVADRAPEREEDRPQVVAHVEVMLPDGPLSQIDRDGIEQDFRRWLSMYPVAHLPAVAAIVQKVLKEVQP